MLGLHCYAGYSLSSYGAKASHLCDFSCRTQALRNLGFRSCNYQTLECKLSNCGAGAKLLQGMWEFPRPGMKPMSLSWATREASSDNLLLLAFLLKFPFEIPPAYLSQHIKNQTCKIPLSTNFSFAAHLLPAQGWNPNLAFSQAPRPTSSSSQIYCGYYHLCPILPDIIFSLTKANHSLATC